MKFKQHILEEKLIDYLLNNVIGKEYESIQKHIHHCDKCRERLYYWQNLLLHNIDESKNPSYTLSSRIWHSWEKMQKKDSQTRNLKSRFLVLSMTILMLILFSVKLFRTDLNQMNILTEQNNESLKENYQQQYTKQLSIEPINHKDQINGHVWVNEITKEMLLHVKGLEQLINRDYQLWIIYTDNTVENHILPIKNGEIKIYFDNINVKNFKALKASIEPKGGSFIQTGPDTFFVSFDE